MRIIPLDLFCQNEISMNFLTRHQCYSLHLSAVTGTTMPVCKLATIELELAGEIKCVITVN